MWQDRRAEGHFDIMTTNALRAAAVKICRPYYKICCTHQQATGAVGSLSNASFIHAITWLSSTPAWSGAWYLAWCSGVATSTREFTTDTSSLSSTSTLFTIAHAVQPSLALRLYLYRNVFRSREQLLLLYLNTLWVIITPSLELFPVRRNHLLVAWKAILVPVLRKWKPTFYGSSSNLLAPIPSDSSSELVSEFDIHSGPGFFLATYIWKFQRVISSSQPLSCRIHKIFKN